VKKRVLWIEDSGYGENVALTASVFLSGRYDLRVAITATSGLEELSHGEFDVVIVDIRLPPGEDPRWIAEYGARGASSKAARLGLRILEIVLGNGGAAWSREVFPEAMRNPLRYGVLTVEAYETLASSLDRLGIITFRNKHAAVENSLLLELIDAVVMNAARLS
jgi:CheY-like chemotaxis protein